MAESPVLALVDRRSASHEDLLLSIISVNNVHLFSTDKVTDETTIQRLIVTGKTYKVGTVF